MILFVPLRFLLVLILSVSLVTSSSYKFLVPVSRSSQLFQFSLLVILSFISYFYQSFPTFPILVNFPLLIIFNFLYFFLVVISLLIPLPGEKTSLDTDHFVLLVLSFTRWIPMRREEGCRKSAIRHLS